MPLKDIFELADWTLLEQNELCCNYAPKMPLTIEGATGQWVLSVPLTANCQLIETNETNPLALTNIQNTNGFIRTPNGLYYVDIETRTIYTVTQNQAQLLAFDRYFKIQLTQGYKARRLTVVDLLIIKKLVAFDASHYKSSKPNPFYESTRLATEWRCLNPDLPAFEFNQTFIYPSLSGPTSTDNDAANFIIECYQQHRFLPLSPFGKHLQHDGRTWRYLNVAYLLRYGCAENEDFFLEFVQKSEFNNYLLTTEQEGYRLAVKALRSLIYLNQHLKLADIKSDYISFKMIQFIAIFQELQFIPKPAMLDLLASIADYNDDDCFSTHAKQVELVKTIADGVYTTPLIYCVAENSRHTQNLLTQLQSLPSNTLKAMINTPNAYGRTPLIFAAGLGQTAVVTTLIAMGADVNHLTFVGKNSALSHAVMKGHTDIVQALLHAKADIRLKNIANQNAFDIAMEHAPQLMDVLLYKIVTFTAQQQKQILAQVQNGMYKHVFEYLSAEYPEKFRQFLYLAEPDLMAAVARLTTKHHVLQRIGYYSFLDYLQNEKKKCKQNFGSQQGHATALQQFYSQLLMAKNNFLCNADASMEESGSALLVDCQNSFHEADQQLIRAYYAFDQITAYFYASSTSFLSRFNQFRGQLVQIPRKNDNSDNSYVFL